MLQLYGCMVKINDSDNIDFQEFKITTGGENIAVLGLDNSLWILVAMGGAWDVKGDYTKIDEFKLAMKSFESFDGENDEDKDIDGVSKIMSTKITDKPKISLPLKKVATLVDLLCSLEPSKMAGYVSCLVTDGFRGRNGSALTYFQYLSPTQQRVIQSTLTSLKRLVEVQNKYSVEESSNKVQLELGPCKVVTAWAADCSWNEALQLSGLATGDLVHTLHRALDALRQIGNVSVDAARSLNSNATQMESAGIHPDI